MFNKLSVNELPPVCPPYHPLPHLGTPCVMFMAATPAKWKVLRVICVPGSPMLCAHRAPTAVPGSITQYWYLGRHGGKAFTGG